MSLLRATVWLPMFCGMITIWLLTSRRFSDSCGKWGFTPFILSQIIVSVTIISTSDHIYCETFVITKPDQVWGVDITYIRISKGFIYLFIIIHWYSRFIVNYELPALLTSFCLKMPNTGTGCSGIIEIRKENSSEFISLSNGLNDNLNGSNVYFIIGL